MNLRLDGWAPEQQLAIATRHGNVLVSAGAGSGKTSVLVERVVSMVCLEPVLDLDQLLIVTFTEAAASEMRERIANRLKELQMQAQADGETAMANRLQRQQALIEQAQISTLHSFCLDVVRRNFFALGLEPSFSILSEEEGTLLKTEILQQLLEDSLQRDTTGVFSKMLKRFQITRPERLQRLVFRVDEFARSQSSPENWLQKVVDSYEGAEQNPLDRSAFIDPFLAWASRRADKALSLCTRALELSTGVDELSKYSDNLEQVAGHLQNLTARLQSRDRVSDLAPTLQALDGLLTMKGIRGKAHPSKDVVRELRSSVKAEVADVMAVLGRGEAELLGDMVALAPQVATFVDFVRTFQHRTWQRKQAASKVDFSDLEHLALSAIQRGDTGERQRLSQRFAQIFVDEYQDTSPIQDAIIGSIQSVDGNLFVVGDVKQSIYRFRMAEPQLFLDKRLLLQKAGRRADGRTSFETSDYAGMAIDLAANYRSRKEIVDMVNLVFGHLFSDDFGGIVYDDGARMRYGAPYPDVDVPTALDGPVELHLISRDGVEAAENDAQTAALDNADGVDLSAQGEKTSTEDDWMSADDLSAMEREALVMADRIKDLMGLSGGPRHQVYDAKAKDYRALQYRDIVILLRSVKGRVNVILDVFQRAGIPAYGATSSGFFAALEVQWLITALAAIDNPRRDVDLAALLRSPIAGFSDADLGWIRMAGSGTFYEAVVRAAKGQAEIPSDVAAKCQEFLRQLQRWRRRAKQATAYEVLKGIIDETAITFYMLGMPGGSARKANVEALLDKARQFDAGSFDGVFGFVRRLRETQRRDLDSGEARTLGETEDVVRIMTIHQSKGLEFPVVFVGDLGKQFYQDPQERMFPLHSQYGFGPQFIDFDFGRRWKTVPSIAVEEVNLAAFLEEEARVLYVALTRARERLILVGSQRNLPGLIEHANQAAGTVTTTDNWEHSEQGNAQIRPFGRQVLLDARTYLDWLLPICLRHPARAELLRVLDDVPDLLPLLALANLDAKLQLNLWNLPGGKELPIRWLTENGEGSPTESGASRATVDSEVVVEEERKAIDTGGALPPFRPVVGSEAELEQWLASAMTGPQDGVPSQSQDVWRRFDDAQSIPGKVTATDLRRLWAKQFHKPTSPRRMGSVEHLLDDPAIAFASNSEDSSAQTASPRARGIAFHAVMQHLPLHLDGTEAAVEAALDELTLQGLVTPEVREAVDPSDVLGFLLSDLGRRLTAAKQVFREQGFFTRIPVSPTSSGDFVVVQGVIDCLAEEQGKWLLIDYKTDRIESERAAVQAQEYAAQVATYVQVANQICGGSPVEAYLYFVHAKTAVKMETVDLSRVFE